MNRTRLQPVAPAIVTVWAVVGLVGGWLFHPVGRRLFGVAPVVTWSQGLLLLLIAAILGGTAWITHRQLHPDHTDPRRRWDGAAPLESYRAVNRLVLARACVMIGALLAGGYAGYTISWLGRPGADLLDDRVLPPGFAAVAGVAVLLAARLLEHACRVPGDPDDPDQRDGDGAEPTT